MNTSPKPFVFVLMPFDKEFDDLFELGIKAACDSVNAYCERVDQQIFQENILSRIYNEIHKADVVVAEMTGRNPNVFYEVGYAHALGKRVILLTKSATDIPFDLKQYSHIIYGNRIVDAKAQLERHLKWYFDHPEDATPDAMSDLRLYLYGTPITTRDAFAIRRGEMPASKPRSGFVVFRGRQYLRFDFSAHNTCDRHFKVLQFSPQLMTFAKYTEHCDPNQSVVRPTPSARTPDGHSAHRFPSPVVVEPGGSTVFSIAIFAETTSKEYHEERATIRLLGDHHPVDFDFCFSVPKADD